jgi:hypothetical protein
MACTAAAAGAPAEASTDVASAPRDVSRNSPATQPAQTEASGMDRQVIVGTWNPLIMRVDGAIVETNAGDNIVFTANDCTWRGMKYGYELLEKETPKIIHLWPIGGRAENPSLIGIYELQGNAFQVGLTSKIDQPLPPDVHSVPDSGFRMVVFQQEAAVERRWIVVGGQIHELLEKCVALLEAGQDLEALTLASHRDSDPPIKAEQRKELIEYLHKSHAQFLATFRAMRQIQPERGFDNENVVFDISKVQGGLPAQTATFKQVDGRWYVRFQMKPDKPDGK